ncbi:SDR family oxidoreductase [Dyadobacter sp. CY312]|uniref:SDR family oxidoreductase n=1 Tax=Dyadobacter sp. CY312 TaxID=2907303 RepID=UPI001F2C1C8D|nr:SDR family oxidoreductase [Dyadobacter sp. CY312]MCE7041298.1 SDR family oxidoreductase [Dyadobacter sp. CY312]
MNLNLTGKTALVCGSTQGIGKATAVELALLGANVTLVARNEEKLRETVETLDTSLGQLHRYVIADFADNQNVKEALENYLRFCPEVHILINNTGGPAGGPIIEADTDQFLKTFQMHLLNYQFIAQAVVPSMKNAGFGRIVNIISTSVKQPIPGLGVSNTIRGAVASWSKTLSLELGQFGITSNNVLPGFTKTARLEAVLEMRSKSSGKSLEKTSQEMQATIPIRRFSGAEEVAAAVAFLCSPAAGSINGVNLPVDGGKTESL